MVRRAAGQSLDDYLTSHIFADDKLETVEPDPTDVTNFDAFMRRYVAALPVERAAVEHS